MCLLTNAGYGVAVGVIMAVSFALGVGAYFRVKGDAANYFVAGHSLPVWMVAVVRITKLLLELVLQIKEEFHQSKKLPFTNFLDFGSRCGRLKFSPR